MKTGIMLLKAIAIITVFAGAPHLVARITEPTQVESKAYNDSAHQLENNGLKDSINLLRSNESVDIKPEQHPLIGYWYVTYEELEMGVTYEFRQENQMIKGYSVEIYDKDENKMQDNTLAMTIKSFEKGSGVAIYLIEYEGQKYEVECELKLKDDKLIRQPQR